MPFLFCAAAGELKLTADRPAQKKSEHYSYPRRILQLTRRSCAPCSPTPEPSFASSASEPNNRPAIDADELESVRQTLERRPGWVFLDPYSPTRLPVAAPVSPA